MLKKNKPKKKDLPRDDINELIKRYESFIHGSRDAILFVRHSNGKILEANAAATDIYQYEHDDLLARTIFDLCAPEKRDQFLSQLDIAATTGLICETVHVKKTGELFPVEVNSQGALIGGERVILSIVRNITERKIAEQLLQESENNLRALLDAVTESFFLMNKNGVILAANDTVAKRYGLSLDSFIGNCIYELITAEIAAQMKMQADIVIRTGKPVRFENVLFKRNIDQVLYPVFDSNNQVVRIAAFGTDITERRKMEEKLENIAFTDQLTGIYNRRGFLNLAERQMKLAKRSKHKMILFYIDLDGMKWINDHLGHEEGDKALINAARIMVKTFRESDIISRIGGDEFAVMAVNADETVTGSLVKRFHNLIDYINSRKGRKYRLSISIGFAVYDPNSPCSLDELMSRADISMYEDKKKNKAAGFDLQVNT